MKQPKNPAPYPPYPQGMPQFPYPFQVAPMPPALPRIGYDVDEAAEMLGLSRSSLYRLVKAGTLHGTKLGGRRIFSEDELREALSPQAGNCV